MKKGQTGFEVQSQWNQWLEFAHPLRNNSNTHNGQESWKLKIIKLNYNAQEHAFIQNAKMEKQRKKIKGLTTGVLKHVIYSDADTRNTR
jgi:hypothetical protein